MADEPDVAEVRGRPNAPEPLQNAPSPDPVEVAAEALYRAFYTDTKEPDRPWPPEKPASHQAWRRAGAAAIDLGARPAVPVTPSA